jgi:hypothetical protein
LPSTSSSRPPSWQKYFQKHFVTFLVIIILKDSTVFVSRFIMQNSVFFVTTIPLSDKFLFRKKKQLQCQFNDPAAPKEKKKSQKTNQFYNIIIHKTPNPISNCSSARHVRWYYNKPKSH